MSRSGKTPKRKIPADAKYQSVVVQKFINKVMLMGKKSLAEKIVYNAMLRAAEILKKDPLEVFDKALKQATPLMEVKARRVGGATYQVPVEVSRERGLSLAMAWIKEAAQSRSGKNMIQKLSLEIVDAHNNTGGAVKSREDMHKTAEANKAFAHFRW